MGFISAIEDFCRDPKGFRKRFGQQKIDLDNTLFMKICQTMHAQAPEGAPTLVMEARFNGDKASFNCYVPAARNRKDPFTFSELAAQQVEAALLEVRASVEKQYKRWSACTVTVHVPDDKYNAEFHYD